MVTYGNDCGIVQKSLPRLREIRDQYKAKSARLHLSSPALVIGSN